MGVKQRGEHKFLGWPLTPRRLARPHHLFLQSRTPVALFQPLLRRTEALVLFGHCPSLHSSGERL